MGKHYTDYERYEHCRKYKISGMNVSEYARVNNLNRNTFKDWVAAYNNINGKFINVSTVSDNDGELIDNGAYRANILREVEKLKKSNHFSRFDHSIVVIEYKEAKITTSLEQAERILKNILSWYILKKIKISTFILKK